MANHCPPNKRTRLDNNAKSRTIEAYLTQTPDNNIPSSQFHVDGTLSESNATSLDVAQNEFGVLNNSLLTERNSGINDDNSSNHIQSIGSVQPTIPDDNHSLRRSDNGTSLPIEEEDNLGSASSDSDDMTSSNRLIRLDLERAVEKMFEKFDTSAVEHKRTILKFNSINDQNACLQKTVEKGNQEKLILTIEVNDLKIKVENLSKRVMNIGEEMKKMKDEHGEEIKKMRDEHGEEIKKNER